AYGLFGIGAAAFATGLALVSAATLGGVLGYVVATGPTRTPWRAAFLVGLGTALLVSCYSFVGWHGSGMENPLLHALFAAVLVALYRSLQAGRISPAVIALVALAGSARLDSPWHLVPLLVAFALYWRALHRDYAALRCCGWVVGTWGVLHLWRYTYFGDLRSMTAYAHRVDPWERLSALISVDGAIWRESARLGGQIALDNAAYLLLAVAPLAPYLWRSRTDRFALVGAASLALTAVLNPAMFGPTFLHPARTTTFIAAIAVIGVVFALSRAPAVRAPTWVAALTVVIAVGLAAWQFRPAHPLCCGVEAHQQHLETFARAAAERRIVRPTVATADLGKLSWLKRFNVVDFGALGSPIVTQLRDDPVAMADYFFEFAQPDFIQMHGHWSCEYGYLQRDRRFAQRYEPLGEIVVSRWTQRRCREYPDSKTGYWVRRRLSDPSDPETALIHDLASTTAAERIERELALCAARAEPTACLYVTRTAYRFAPELRAQGSFERVMGAFGQTHTAAYDQALLGSSRRGAWYRVAVQFIRAHAQRPSRARVSSGGRP
ncbi:MAG: hypothetical protein JRI23_09950, partial [Deltaproteobacteria bacterium]|nr:hypothetical protein [Deltaproteobacteria bacterium]MBW2531991.1 hypothetical protein [Deltaproteobacteria bacterium]